MFRRHKLIAIAIGVGFLMIITVLPSSVTQRFRSGVAKFYSPLQVFFTSARDTARSTLDKTRSTADLLKENRELQERLKQYEWEIRRAKELAAENARLQQMLKLKNSTRLSLLAARVLGRDPSNWWKSVQIDRGTNDGVTVNAAVITHNGLVGKIISAGATESRVLLLVDRSCQVSGLLQDTRDPGLIMGGVSEMGPKPRLKMTFISRLAKIEPNTTVVTSGMGGVFPPGLLIGTVANAQRGRRDVTGLYQEVEVVPAVDFKNLEEVFVVIGQ